MRRGNEHGPTYTSKGKRFWWGETTAGRHGHTVRRRIHATVSVPVKVNKGL